MSVTSGFFNSINGDRKYDAEQLSSIFDGLIIDGVFASIGTAFAVHAGGGLVVNVGIGKAWFHHTWTVNDSILPLVAPAADLLSDRIDAVVLEVNRTESVRRNSIKIVTGTPSVSPQPPVLANAGAVYQYPLCHIRRRMGSSSITESDITPMVGSKETPFVTTILQTISLDELLGKWQDELNRFIANRSQDVNHWIQNEESKLQAWLEEMKSDLENEKEFLKDWLQSNEINFLDWFDRMKGQLSEDAAGHLQLSLDRTEIKRILMIGFEDGTKTFSDDGKIITLTAKDGRILTKTYTNHFQTLTSVLKSKAGTEVARLVKTFSPNGKLISTEITYR